MKIFVILHNIRSLHNIGSIFRTAEGLGASKIYLTGYTTEPYDFFGKLRKDFVKTALGVEKYISWEKQQNIFSLIKQLKQDGVKIVALEQSKNSVPLNRFALKKKFKKHIGIALIAGNEIGGVPKSVLQKCDKIIEIHMRGEKESLNVSVAAGIALYALCACRY